MPGLAMLQPLRERDFRLLWLGLTVSLIGDGIYFVAIAWQVYDLTDSPSALSLVGLCWSVGMVAFLLAGGIAADRVERRRLMVASDAARMLVMLALGLLAVNGELEVWHLAVLSIVHGGAEAFFGPAFTGLIPQLVREQDLVQANALQEVARPITYRLAGPALGGLLVAAFGAGTALLIDAGTFLVSLICLSLLGSHPLPPTDTRGTVLRDLKDGLAFVRARAWLWGTLVTAALSLLCFWGPVEVLLPYLIRHDLGQPASAFGLVLAAAGAGGILGAMVMSHRGLPKQKLRFMYLAWGLGPLSIAGYALASAVWQMALLAACFGAGMSMGMVVWATLMQTRVPADMLGRVSSLDWLVSIGLTPISFALTAPIVALAGADATLIGAGTLACGATFLVFLLVRDLRRDEALHADLEAALDERREVLPEARVDGRRGLHPDDVDAVARR